MTSLLQESHDDEADYDEEADRALDEMKDMTGWLCSIYGECDRAHQDELGRRMFVVAYSLMWMVFSDCANGMLPIIAMDEKAAEKEASEQRIDRADLGKYYSIFDEEMHAFADRVAAAKAELIANRKAA